MLLIFPLVRVIDINDRNKGFSNIWLKKNYLFSQSLYRHSGVLLGGPIQFQLNIILRL